ncbi:sulfite exporter TauE/SafE family protein [Reinekea blandensis]|uniref:Probable membrane transporter protein n=1 Tax=Reinekea blandensis MED297 TaxID=314283 RepID=A4BBD4_9GAMM|nr:sulfite exporter TauE/SafE family protein [Reinekea blandensis]EAR10747.1 Predicted permease [Reinekea sp. MED297] [Reinekea blandensis MED297]
MTWTLLGLAIFAAWTIDAAIGFGSLVIALAIGALLLPLEVIMPILVPLNILLSGYLTVRYRRQIQWSLMLKTIGPFMVIGTLVGLYVADLVPETQLRLLFGAIVVWFAARSLWLAFDKNAQPNAHRALTTRVLTFAAGITHGLFASGGPLLVYALTGVTLLKQQFRATLSLVWFLLNSGLTLWFVKNERLLEQADKVLWYVPVVIAAIVFGEWLHHRVSEDRFRKVVLVLLLIAGILLLLK